MPAKTLGNLDAESFRKACSRFATGVAVATVKGRDGKPYGVTVNSFTSVSCSPPLVLICVDHRCAVLPHFRSSPFFGINILAEDQRDLSVRFSQKQVEQFEGLDWHSAVTGSPLLSGTLANMECCTTLTVEAGDHTILVAEVLRAELREGRPLLYFGSAYRQLPPIPG
ncbi:MAG: flavin reductase family protein [Acidobacteria bacterium]|nr:flavin reductase family protein [Acidobacteriota bacterium]MBI3278222.1 flavin reductase family protein [Acidobacteriota bacterium]